MDEPVRFELAVGLRRGRHLGLGPTQSDVLRSIWHAGLKSRVMPGTVRYFGHAPIV